MINCLNPVIIRNRSRHVNRVFRSLRDWTIIIRGKESFVVPSPQKAKILPGDLDDCYYLNIHSGEMIPIYLEVPCSKCIICKDKKALDWATRITCEGNYHTNCPWWITLTYNDYNCPFDGLNKKDLQNFFKRLRERISRQVGEDIRIRFVAVGEYGGNTARPHYHAQIFGMPLISPRDILVLLENAWSKRISHERYLEIVNDLGSRSKDFTFTRLDINGKKMYYERIGFAYVKPAHDNTPLYLAKYMFKPEVNTPFGMTPNFCLASRKNGIGFPYIQDHMQYHRNNPEVTKIEFLNKHTMKLCKFAIPSYFKDYWFPTPSKIIPDDVRKSYDLFLDHYIRYSMIQKYALDHRILSDLKDDVESMVSDLSQKYFFYKPLINIDDLDYDLHRSWFLECKQSYYIEGHHYVEIFGLYCPMRNYEVTFSKDLESYVKTNLMQSYCNMLAEYEYMMSLEFSDQWMKDVLVLRDIHKGAITQMMLAKPEVSPIDTAARIYKQFQRLKAKDMY